MSIISLLVFRGSDSVVECDLAKVEVAGSNPVFRSKIRRHSQVVRQRSAKSPSPVQVWVAPPKFDLEAHVIYAEVAELADAQDLKSCEGYTSYRFDSDLRHQIGY